jgi:adenosylcobinamide-GDP ribazoletransferase
MGALVDGWRALLLAGRFLTRWPFPASADAPPALYGHAAPFYPVIGLLIGAVLSGLGLAAQALGVLPAGAPALAVLLLVLWVWSTGALHLDGLADCADAWVGGLGSRERTFAILKDPHIGAMGVATLVLNLLAKLGALVTLLGGVTATLPAPAVSGAWLAALLWVPVLGRAQILWLALTTPAARPEGLGAALGAHLPRRAAWLAAALGSAAALAGIGVASVPAAAAAAGTTLLVLFAWRGSLLRRLGGYTGDGIGALVELTETLALLAVALVAAVPAAGAG